MDIFVPKVKVQIDQSDYTKDGLIYCGKCNTPKQWRGVLLGRQAVMPCLCECAKQKRDADEKAEKERIRKQRIEEIRNEAFQDGRMKAWTFENDDLANPELSRKMQNYAKNFKEFKQKGRGLLLYGTTGNGKTFMACCIANRLIDLGYSVLVKNFNSISNELFSTQYKDEYMENLNGVSLLVLDDMDIERDSAYMNEVVYSVIDGRYRANKPVIVTTNLSATQLRETSSMEKKRVYSRLMDMCVPISVVGQDRRYSNAKANYVSDLELLNG